MAIKKQEHNPLESVDSIDMLQELVRRGGHPGAIAKAVLLCVKKSLDYNPEQTDIHTIDRTSYFPFGTPSYAQMISTKSQRFVALTHKLLANQDTNFEGLDDTALDIINYAGFYLAWVEGGSK